jgi:putative ubiquitin-RnfH superfamily antitoxin RatB of RatAB toxin-antitoxin module
VSGKLRAEVVYALPGGAHVVAVELQAGATLGDALAASGLAVRFPEITQHGKVLGVFGERRPLDSPLADGDRIEIYRPLRVDPKEARRRRATRPRRITGTTG